MAETNPVKVPTESKPTRGRPKGRSGTREKIIIGAASAFARDGYERTSVERILEEAGVSRRTFYRMFSNKEEVFTELVRRAIRVMLREVEGAVADADSLEAKLDAGIGTYLRLCMQAGPIARVVLLEPMPPGSEAARHRESAVSTMQNLIHREISARRHQNVDPLVLHGLVAALDSVGVRLAMERNPHEWDLERARRVMARIMGGALAAQGDTVPPLPLADNAD